MGRGNVCVFGKYEGLYYIDNALLHEYTCHNEDGEYESRKQGELSYEELTGNHWRFDEWQSNQNWEDAKYDFITAIQARFPSLQKCSKRIEHDRLAILENNLFYVAVADNEWGQAVMLIQKEHWCYDLTGLQKRHYQRYLDAIRDSLFEQFDTLGTYAGAWTHGTICRSDIQKRSA